MLNIQKYLNEGHSDWVGRLEDLKKEFDITIHEYPELVVLNYGIKSPKFNPICEECRGLILEKGTWKVLSRAFDRFYNFEEGEGWKTFSWEKARYYEKLDGTLISVYWYQNKWNVATRSMAFAEGPAAMGIGTFYDLFMKAASQTHVLDYIEHMRENGSNHVYIFELTSPENRIVTRYADTKITLLAARQNPLGSEGFEYECTSSSLDLWASEMRVARPKCYDFSTMEQVIDGAKSLDTLDEGFVAVIEGHPFKRLKCKNPRYVAIAHIRDNGKVSAKRLLALALAGEASEFLSYFPEYTPYFQFVDNELKGLFLVVKTVWEETKHIESQKEFALTIQKKTSGLALGCLFSMKKGRTFEEATKFDSVSKLYKSLDLKKKFEAHFKLQVDEDDEEN